MSKRSEIQVIQSTQKYTRRNARLTITGKLGNNSGTIEVADDTSRVWVRLHGDDNQVIRALCNASIPREANLVVELEEVKRSGMSFYQVLGIAAGIVYVDNPYAGKVGAHADQHEWNDHGVGGFDRVNVFGRSIVPLRARAQATPDDTVYVEAGFYNNGAGWKYWAGGSSGSFSFPVADMTRRYDLLYLGSDDALHIQQGAASVTLFGTPALPTAPDDDFTPIALVLTQTSQTTIEEEHLRDPSILKSAAVRLIADNISMDRIAGSTYSTVQHMQDTFHSAGWISGGVISDAGGATIDVTAGAGFIRSSASAVGNLLFFDWAAMLGIAIPANTTRYIGIEYNAGSPQVTARATLNWNYYTDFPLGCVVNEAGTLHISFEAQAVGDHAAMMIRREYEVMPLARDERDGGLMLGETGTRNVTLTAGSLWDRLNRFVISALDTSGADTFDRYYRDGGGGFTKEAAQTQWNNTQYDDGSGALATLTANRYCNIWWYLETDNDLVALYGQSQYTTLASAEEESPPATTPGRIDASGRLIGRFVFQKSAVTTSIIQSVFDVSFSPSSVTNHANLSNLDFSVAGHTGLLPVANGGTNLATWTQYGIVYASATNVLAQLGLGTTTQVLHGNAAGAATFSALVEADLGLTDLTTANVSTSVHGFAPKAVAPAANVLNVLGIANGETVSAWKALFDATNPADTGTAAPGTSLLAAHRDHVHALATPGTLTVATTNSAVAAHTHAITSSSNPGAAAAILASDANGGLGLVSLVTPTINGGTAANNDITIQGTTHATRTTSYVLLQPNGGNVGIGNIAPDATLAFAGSHLSSNTLKINLFGGTPQGFGTAANIMYAALAGATDSFVIYDTVTKTNALFTVKGAGGAVIGATASTALLTVSSDDTNTAFGTASTAVRIINTNAGAAGRLAEVQFAQTTGRYAAISGYLTNGGGNTQGDIVFSGRVAAGDANLTEAMRIISNGNVVIGTTSAAGLLTLGSILAPGAGTTHLSGHDGLGGMRWWTYDGVDGTSRTIIANGTGDALYVVRLTVVIRDSTGGINQDEILLNPGNSTDVISGGSAFRFTYAADGSLTVARNSGSATAKINVLVLWL